MDDLSNIPEKENNSDIPKKTDETAASSQENPQSARSGVENNPAYTHSYEAYIEARNNHTDNVNTFEDTSENPYSPYRQTMNDPYAPRVQQVYTTPSQQFGMPQSYSKSSKGNRIGKTIFVIILCLCLVSASLAIGYSVKDFNGTSPPVTDALNNSQTGDLDGPNVTISPTPTPSEVSSSSMTAAEIYKKVKDINVGVLVYSNNNLAGEGSGVVMGEDKNGKFTYVITCAHVISENGTSIRVRFADNSDIGATVLGYDRKTDIGVLKVEKTGLLKAQFGEIKSVAVGQTVYAIGNPGGTEFFGSFTTGMVSAVDRPVDSAVGYSQPCIQHTAAINPGNSGGALLNEFGQVIGINSSKIAETDYEGMGFAVPINTVKTVVDEIISHGYVTNRPKLGITYSPISESQIYSIIVQSNGLPTGSIIIREIDSESDLNSKGVQINDLIIKANGKDLTSTNTLPEMIDNMKVNDTLTLTICRINSNYTINKPFNVKVKLIEDKGYTETEPSSTTAPFFNPFG